MRKQTIVVIVVLLAIVAGLMWVRFAPSQNPPQPKPVAVSTPTPASKQYTDEKLQYGFTYPSSAALVKCSDTPCASIESLDLRINPLYSYQFDTKNPVMSLLKTDLYCSAAGPMGTVDCKNTKVEQFTNSNGVTGYKVTRTKTYSGKNERIIEDIAYVFPLRVAIKNKEGFLYSGVLFAVDPPRETSLTSLKKIANSYSNLK